MVIWKEGNVLFNDARNTFLFTVIWKKEEVFYLTTHSTHFIYGYMEEGRSVLFNDALNTFLFTVIWCRTYGPFR